MSTADAREEIPPEPDDERAPVSSARSPRLSPGLSAGWLLRAAGYTAVAAGLLAMVVAPGVRGNAPEWVVVLADRAAGCLGYSLGLILLALTAWGAFELVRIAGLGPVPRLALIAACGVVGVLALLMVAARDREGAVQITALMALVTCVAAVAGAWASARTPHTRAVSGVLVALAFAAMARLAAWTLAMWASDHGSMQVYHLSRGLATAGVLFESFGQLVAVAWLGTRSKSWGQLGSLVALAGALVLSVGAARGVHSGAPLWEAVLHTALADASGVPSPFWLESVAVFLVPSSLLLALVSVAQPKQVAAVVAITGLALVSRGAFDAPLRALCGVTAAVWAALACADERAMWRTLIDDRKRRLEEEGAGQV